MLRNLEKMWYLEQLSQKRFFIWAKRKPFILNFTSCFRVSQSAQAIVQIFGRFKVVFFPFTSQRYYQFSRFILQYNKMHHRQSTYQLIRRHVESISQHGRSYWSGSWAGEWTRTKSPAIYIFCYSNNVYIFSFL